MFADRTLQEIHIPRPAAPRQLSLFGAAGREPARPALYGSLRRPVVPQETALFDFVLADLEKGSLAALGEEEGWRLVLSLEGSAVCQAGSQTISLQAGDGILQRADRSLVCRPREGGWQALILRFDESALALTDRKLKKTRPNPFRLASPAGLKPLPQPSWMPARSGQGTAAWPCGRPCRACAAWPWTKTRPCRKPWLRSRPTSWTT